MFDPELVECFCKNHLGTLYGDDYGGAVVEAPAAAAGSPTVAAPGKHA
jgi:hypothetical protein